MGPGQTATQTRPERHLRIMSRTQPEQPTRTRVAPSASTLRHARPGVVSRDAAHAADILLRLPPTERRNAFQRHLTARERAVVMTEVERATGSLYGLWRDTPSGFVGDVLGESLWSKRRAGRFWFTSVRPVGTALCTRQAGAAHHLAMCSRRCSPGSPRAATVDEAGGVEPHKPRRRGLLN